MKSDRQKNLYEILDVRTDASPLEIRRAYQELFELYQAESMASYSFFSEEDRKELLSRIEEAYLLLIDDERRDSYDQQLIEAGLMSEAMRQRRPQKTPLPLYETMQRHPGHLRPDLSVKSEPVVAGGSPAVRELLVKDAISGGDLKQARMAMGITLDHIARESRIKIGILQAIEEEEEDHLPPLAYLKGFIRSYARCLQIDDQQVLQAYLKHRDG